MARCCARLMGMPLTRLDSSRCAGFREATKRKRARMAESRTFRVAAPFLRSRSRCERNAKIPGGSRSFRSSSATGRFLSARSKRPVAELDLKDLDPPGILAFLSHLERERKNGAATRNVRLSAIRALFRFVASRNPEHLELAQRVRGIPLKRAQQRAIDYLEREEIESILKAIDRTTPKGSRDHALLATMFNTGARVQEIADLRACDLQLSKPFQVRLLGKGRKERYCPLWPQTAAVLRAFSKERNLDLRSEVHVFLNHRDAPLTRFGIRYILARCLHHVGQDLPNLHKKRLHPHSMRYVV